MKIQTILGQIDLGSMALPEFQRGYVWNRDQVRDLILSLYRKHPVGSLLVWATRTEDADTRGDATVAPGVVKLLLDGQQRITSLYGIIRGRPPRFFDGNAQAFTGLYFHLDDEAFEFYSPLEMKDDPLWINVTELMQQGVGPAMTASWPVPKRPSFLTHPPTHPQPADSMRGNHETLVRDLVLRVVLDRDSSLCRRCRRDAPGRS